MTELVHYDVADGVATITLDSPHNRNALSRQLVGELFAAVDRAETDDEARVVLLGSEGKQSASIRQITTYPDSIYRLAQEVMTHLVTPAALQDVVDDWLAAV